MKIKQIYLPSSNINPYVDDSYFYIISEGKNAIAFDPGVFDEIDSYLTSQDLNLIAILNTHHHPDHVGANIKLKQKYNCPVYGSIYDKDRIPGISDLLGLESALHLLGLDIRILDLKAHTLGLIGYYIPQLSALFPGDAIFSGGCGKLFEGSEVDLYNSFSVIKNLPMDTQIYCSHEYTLQNLMFAESILIKDESLIKYKEKVVELRKNKQPTIPCLLKTELKINPFFKVFDDSFLSQHKYASAAQAIGHLRELKDNFK